VANENIVISEELFSKIKSTLKAIKVSSKDKDIIKEVEALLFKIDDAVKEDATTTTTIVEKIQQKMRDLKYIDPDAHANLYILHRKLIDNKISESEALAIFKMYNNNPAYNKYNTNKIIL